MNEKEKARELVRQYLIAVYDDGQPFDKMLHLHKTEVKVPAIQRAKQCALIACDNTIAQLSELIDPENVSFWHGNKAGETIGGIELQEYWQSVRAEIEKL